jgi:hypothetical protein
MKKQPISGGAVVAWLAVFIIACVLVPRDYLIFVWIIIPLLYVSSRAGSD